jgi:hypothetical protein
MIRPLALAAALLSLAAPALAREVEFAGHAWYVRDYPGGPGPNTWSADDVFVDDAGLHMFIGEANGVWTSTEVVMLGPPLGFGTYEFEVTGAIDSMDRNVVLGLFNYPLNDSVGPNGTNEIDIEITPWGDRQNPNRLNWTVYPSAPGPKSVGEHRVLKLSGDASTHRFIWSATGVDYASYDGYPDSPGYALLHSWNYAPDNPALHVPQVPLVLHINLWLLDGVPEKGEPVEVIIRNFRFTPAP